MRGKAMLRLMRDGSLILIHRLPCQASLYKTEDAFLDTIESAQRRLIQCLPRVVETELVSLDHALGRFLALGVQSQHDVPPSAVSLFDGYALTAPTHSAQVRAVAGLSYAGDAPQPLPSSDVAWRIFTGAALPFGSDAVIAQESVTLQADGTIVLNEALGVGAGVRQRGADTQIGQCVLSAGTRLDAAHLGLLASVGVAAVTVVRLPRVALFTTGDELVAPGSALSPGKIFNANHALLRAAMARLSVDVLDLGVLPDEPEAIRVALLRGAAEADLVLTSGGVSVGDADFVRQVVADMGGIDTWRVFLKPGKPLALGRIGATPFIGLPGNPVSTFVTFFLFVRPALRHMVGADPEIDHPALRLPLAQPWAGGDRPEFIRVKRARSIAGHTQLLAFPNQNSGLLSSIAWADGVALIPADCTLVAGDFVDYFPFEGWYL
jgi:molybdopterin molybdotransferase